MSDSHATSNDLDQQTATPIADQAPLDPAPLSGPATVLTGLRTTREGLRTIDRGAALILKAAAIWVLAKLRDRRAAKAASLAARRSAAPVQSATTVPADAQASDPAPDAARPIPIVQPADQTPAVRPATRTPMRVRLTRTAIVATLTLLACNTVLSAPLHALGTVIHDATTPTVRTVKVPASGSITQAAHPAPTTSGR